MFTIRFQNPIQGPLITISFGDNDGVALAFVPATLSSAPADIVATSTACAGGAAAGVGIAGPLAIAVICSGDSSPRHLMPEVTHQPLRGLSRFRSAVNSATLDGEQVSSDASPAGPDPVGLPGESTESTTTAVAAAPVDWAALLRADVSTFFALLYDRIDEIKHDVLRRLDRGDTPESVIAWLRTEAVPEVKRVGSLLEDLPGSQYFSIKHDLGHKITDLAVMIPYYAGKGDIANAREFCRTDLQNMESLFSQLRLIFLGRASVEKRGGLVDFEIHSPEDAKQWLRILENLIRNAADHSRDGAIPRVTIERDGNRFVVRDNASGMDEVTVQKLRDGVRIHDGEEVTSSNETPETKDHGFGWQSIRETSDKLGIRWELESQPGKGTTVTLIVLDGFFVPH